MVLTGAIHRKTNGIISNSVAWLAMTVIIIILLIADGLITNLPYYDLPTQQSRQVAIFYGILVLVCALSQLVYLRIIGYNIHSYPLGLNKKYTNTVHFLVSLAQYVVVALLITNVVEVLALGQYDTSTLKILIFSSILVSVCLSGLLAFRFLLWTRNRRDYIIIAYCAVAILMAINSMFVAFFMGNELENKPNVIDSSRNAISATMVVNYNFKAIQSDISVVAFLSLWLASVLLLRYRRRSWGNVKFYIVIGIPLIYYFGIFQWAISNILIDYGNLNSIQNYTLVVVNSTLSKPVGGILFGLAFWIVGRSVKAKNIRNYLKISAFGIILVSLSNQDAGLYLLPYPPFGLATITFAGISSYLLYFGIYYTAVSASQDANLRRADQHSEDKLGFVASIGRYQAERDMENRVKGILKRSAKVLQENSSIESSLEEMEMREYMETLLVEKEKMLMTHNPEFSLYNISTTPCGKSWDEWIQLWWKWCYSEPFEKSPVADSSGQYCCRGQLYDDIWFLAGTFGEVAERRCEIPEGRSLFFPIVNDIISFATDPHLRSETDLREYAKADLDTTKSLNVKIDGVSIDASGYHRIQSSIFEIVLPLSKSSGIPTNTKAISDGFWVFLQPLSTGYHQIEINGEKLDYDKEPTLTNSKMELPLFRVKVTYHLKIG
jgi:hypothetical protein